MTATAFLLTGGGLALLFFGGEFLLRGAVAIAIRSGLSPLLIGLTIVACATSMPELLVTVTAGMKGVTDVGVGNIVGSNIANILLILGVAAFLRPIEIHPKLVLRDTCVMLGATGLFIFFALMGEIGLFHGGAMLAVLVVYLWATYRLERSGNVKVQDDVLGEVGTAPCSMPIAALLMALGLGGLVGGSELLIMGAVDLARAAGISETVIGTVIGITLVAIGTSLPELATAIVAGMRGHTDVALGNVVGSNTFNLLLIVGTLAILTPFSVAAEVVSVDMWIMAAASLALLPVMFIMRRIGRIEGGVFLVLYIAFIAYQLSTGQVTS
jgi:cation:H+ antiporter